MLLMAAIHQLLCNAYCMVEQRYIKRSIPYVLTEQFWPQGDSVLLL